MAWCFVAATARRRPGSETQRRDLGDRRDVAEERREAGVVVDERPIRLARGRGELVEDRRPGVDRAGQARDVLGCRGEKNGAGHLLEMAAGDGHVGVVGRDDLALLGQLEPAVDRARGLAEDRPVRRSPAAADRAAAAVEEGQLDAPGAGRRGQDVLGSMERPRGGDEPRFLVRIGVAEHHLLAIAARRQVRAIGGVVEEGLEDRACGVERARSIRRAGRHRGRGARSRVRPRARGRPGRGHRSRRRRRP